MSDSDFFSDEFESESLEDIFADVKPMRQNDKADLHSPQASVAKKQKRASLHHTVRAQKLNPLSMESVTPVDPDDFLSFQQPGIQDGVFKNVRQGKYEIERRLSLKGLTLAESRDQLYSTLLNSHNRGVRMVLVQHGRGEQSKPFPALKKSYVNHWLRELEEVIAFHSAQPVHGGSGATYVLLKKHPEQKQINRERNRKG